MKLKHIILALISISLAGCLTPYEKVEPSKKAAFLKFERSLNGPLLGTITRYVKVDDKQKCREAYSEHKLLAVQNQGNPLVSDLNVDGLYVNPGDFRIQINTVAGVRGWCDVFVELDVKSGEKYKIVTNGNMYDRGTCSSKLYKLSDSGTYEKAEFKKYQECNK